MSKNVRQSNINATSNIKPFNLFHDMAMFPIYKYQSSDLLCKSTDWSLYEGNIVMKKVKLNIK